MSGFILRDPRVLGFQLIQDPVTQQQQKRQAKAHRAEAYWTSVFRDTSFGHVVRFLSRGSMFPYPYEQSGRELARYMSTATVSGDSQTPSDSSTPESGYNPIRPTDKGVATHELITWIADDPDNPQNWSFPKRVFVTFQICLLTTSVFIGSAIFTAGLGGVAEHFQVSETVALIGLTMFVLGYGVGPMIWSPLQEIPHFGKTPIYVLTLVLFVALQPAVIYAPNIGTLLFFRFLTGLFGSPVLATGGASLVDIHTPSGRGYAITVWGVANVLGPALGPVIGGFAAQYKNWQWPLWELMWLSGFCLAVIFFFLPETTGQTILYHRARRIRKIRGPGAVPVMTAEEIAAKDKKIADIVYRALVRPFILMFSEPIVLASNVYMALVYACLYLFFESFPIVFTGMYGFPIGTLGLAYLGILVGVLLSLIPYFYYLSKFLKPQFGPAGELRPEIRLQVAVFAAFLIPVSLFWFAWSSGNTHWIGPIMATGLFGPGAFLLFNSVLSYLADTYTINAGSVFASNALARASCGATFPLFAGAMYNKLGIGWGNTVLAFLTTLFIPIAFVLYRYGGKLRLMSKEARHDMAE